MIWPFKKKSVNEKHVLSIYNAIVAQSRQVPFYRDMKVPDSVTGRFDMISLHMCLVLRQLRSDDKNVKQFTQDLFDLFFKDMDSSLREIGVSDVAVPKKIQKMGSLFYGLLGKLTNALDDEDEAALIEILNNNIYDGSSQENALTMAKYVNKTVSYLKEQKQEDIMLGQISFGENL